MPLPLKRPRVFWVLSGNVMPMSQVNGSLPPQAPKPMLSFLWTNAKPHPSISLPFHIRPTFWINAIEPDHRTRIIDEKELDLFSFIKWLMGWKEKCIISELWANPSIQWACIHHTFTFCLFPHSYSDVSKILIGAPIPNIQCQLPLSLWI